jgi:hypothetical protein
MRRAAQGSINSSADLSIALQRVLKPMIGMCALVFIDDVLLSLGTPRPRGRQCAVSLDHQDGQRQGQAEQAELYTEEAHWLGLVLTKERGKSARGCRVWRRCSVRSRQMCCRGGSAGLGWMRNHLPNFARVVEPLLKNEAFKLVGSLKSSERVNLDETGMRQPVHDLAWGATIVLLRNAIALAYPKPATHGLAVLSDASDMG